MLSGKLGMPVPEDHKVSGDEADKLKCPLCMRSSEYFHRDPLRTYFQCERCRLVFVPPWELPTREEEKACYDLHQNDPEDLRYRRFLSRLFLPLQAQLEPHSDGLDFGSGPGPTLSLMFAEVGHRMRIYDPFYAPEQSVWQKQYDFITASEVVEHLHQPGQELERLWSILKPGGWLGIMTKRLTTLEAFATWHYKNDPTHVAFFAAETFTWLAGQWGAVLQFCANDVVLFRKPFPQSPRV